MLGDSTVFLLIFIALLYGSELVLKISVVTLLACIFPTMGLAVALLFAFTYFHK